MSDSCTHDCNTCGSGCAGCGPQEGGPQASPQDFLAPLNELSTVKHVIGVMSGKGGVGKSLVTASLAVQLQRKGYRVAILDADITGPSIPRQFGLSGIAEGSDFGTMPKLTETGIPVMSLNFLVEHETDPVVWRGPMIADLVRQFWTSVVWGYVDYMLVDLPPGTGDVPLTVYQSLPLDGVVVVTSPQDLVSMVVAKAVKMARMMNVDVLGLVENYSYFKCPDCGQNHQIFGSSKLDTVAKDLEVPVLDRLPIDPAWGAASDSGQLEAFTCGYLDQTIKAIEAPREIQEN